MKLECFQLEHWLDSHSEARFQLGGSTGPNWTTRELLDLLSEEERAHLWGLPLAYSRSAGGRALRQSIASLHGVRPEDVVVTTGASEGLLLLYVHAAREGGNVVTPSPCFPTFTAVPAGLGLEVRRYRLRPENEYQIDPDEIAALIDDRTALLLVNSPHNPTGSVVEPDVMRWLHELCDSREIQFVVDEVYHPIYHEADRPSAAVLPRTTILGDMSKAYSLPGLRIGWIIERDAAKVERYVNDRAYFTISNSPLGEMLAEAALRHREAIFGRAREVAGRNLALLDRFLTAHRNTFEWVPPRGGFTVFPRLRAGEDARPFCTAAAARGVVMAPGDTFGFSAHFRVGFGAAPDGLGEALDILTQVLVEVGV